MRASKGDERPGANGQAREAGMNHMATVTTTATPGGARRWAAFAILCVSLLVIMLDNTILNVALPTIARDLSTTASQLQWIVDSYVLVFAGLLLTMGSLGDRFGRKRALDIGLLIFGAGSLWAAWSGSAGQLIAARALMGVGGALIMPSTLSITTNLFSGAERTWAIGAWAGISGLGIVLGPLTGGWLLERFAWGAVFLINLPLVALALIAGWSLIPESRDPEARALDPVGAILSIAGLTALVWAIIEAPARGWTDGAIVATFAAAATLLALFAAWELRSRAPMLDMRLFRNPRFTAASLAISLVFFALFGTLFFLTQYLQFVLGYGALEAGIRLTPLVGGLLPGAAFSTRLVGRLGTKALAGAGLLIITGGLALLSTATVASGYGLLALVLAILGVGMGLTMPPATDSIMGALPPERAGVGSAVNDTTRQLGGALGVAVLGSILSSAYRETMAGAAALGALPAPLAEAARDSVGAATVIARQLGGGAATTILAVAHAAFIDAMGRAVIVAAVVAGLGALIALLFLPARAREGEREDQRAAAWGAEGLKPPAGGSATKSTYVD